MQNCGPAAKAIVEAIDELSGLDKEAITEASARFPSSGEVEERAVVGDGASAGSSGPAVSL
jgi:UDP-3-O-[3-hydroxymyristoyl] glucosamine N-acyltransferase